MIAPPFRPSRLPSAIGSTVLTGIVLFALGLAPSPAHAQTSFALSASAGTGVFDGVAFGMAHRPAAPALFSSVSVSFGVASSAGVAVAHHRPAKRHHRYGHRGYHLSCWDAWDPWYGYWPGCDPWWAYGWAPVYPVYPPPVRYAHPSRFHPGWSFSIHVGRSWGWYDPYWAWGPHYAWGPRWHATHVYYPTIWVVPPPRVVVHRPPPAWVHRPGVVSPATGYKENPGAPAPTRTAVPRTAAGPGGGATAAPPPDIRTRPSGTATRTGSGVADRSPPRTATGIADRAPTRTGEAGEGAAGRGAVERAPTPGATSTRPSDRALPGDRTNPRPDAAAPSRANGGSSAGERALPTVIRGTPPASTRAAPPTSARETPPANTRQTPPASTRQTPPANTRQTPPANTRQTPPANTRQTPPANTRQTPPANTRQTPPANTRQTPPANTRQTPPANTRQTPPANTRQAPPARTNPPAASRGTPPATSRGNPPAASRGSSSPPARSAPPQRGRGGGGL